VSVSFFYRYRWGDQNKEYSCGAWPRKSLTDIRKARNQARALIDDQINPNEQKKTAKSQAHTAANAEAEQEKTRKVQTLTVQDLAKAWLLDGVARKDGNAELQRRFNKDLYPALGKISVDMMQALGVSLDVIDRCQNHVLAGSRVRRHYLHHDYAEEKKRAWNLLGDRLSAVLSLTYEHPPAEPMMFFPAYAAKDTRPPSSVNRMQSSPPQRKRGGKRT
jgi:hypothetical protein